MVLIDQEYIEEVNINYLLKLKTLFKIF